MKIKKILMLATAITAFVTSTVTVTSHSNDTYISQEIQDLCVKYGEEYSICPELIMAMIESESSGDPKAENGNCKGLMQVSEKWHEDRMKELGVTDLFNADGNVHVGVDYLSELFEDYDDCCYALDVYNGNSQADYNAEHGIVSKYAKKILTRSEELERIHNK